MHVCMHAGKTVVHGQRRPCAIYVHVCGTRYDMYDIVRLFAVRLVSRVIVLGSCMKGCQGGGVADVVS